MCTYCAGQLEGLKIRGGGGSVVMWWELYAPAMVEIGLSDLPKSGGAVATLAPWAPTGLLCTVVALHSGEF